MRTTFCSRTSRQSSAPNSICASRPAKRSKAAGFVSSRRRSGTTNFVEIEGTPDLVVEIVSDASKRKDLTVLRAAYHRGGIAEYSIVDARGESLRFEILSHTDQGYVASSPETGPQRSVVLGLGFSLERSRNRVGRWSYRLSIVD